MDELDLSDLTDPDPLAPPTGRVETPSRRPHRPARRPVVLLVGLLAVVALVVLVLTRPDPAPVLPPPDRGDSLRFDPLDGADPLVASVIGRPGESRVRLRFTPRSLDLALSIFCYRPTRQPAPDDGWGSDTVLLVAGRTVGGGVCTDTPAVPGPTPVDGDRKAVRGFWSRLGVKVGRPVELELVHRQPTAAASPVRIGVGVYELSGQRITAGSATLRTVIPLGGKDYRLEDYQMIPVGERPVGLRMPVEGSGRRTVALAVLRADRPWAEAAARLTSDAGTDELVTTGEHLVPLPRTPGTLDLSARRGFSGEMVLAWYSQTG